MKRVLLPTDFSDTAWNAIQYAIALLKHKQCTFYVLNTFTVNYSTSNLMAPEPGNRVYDLTQKKSKEKLHKIIDELESLQNPRHQFKPEPRNNFLIDAINYLVDEKAIDMIVMGTKGQKKRSGVFYGSNAEIVMEKVFNCPVIVVPESVHFNGLKEVAFPDSYEFAIKTQEIRPFIDFIKDFESTIRVVHIKEAENLSSQQMENKKLLEEELSGMEYTIHELTNIEPALGISCFAQSRDVDIIAIVNRKHNFFYRLLEKQTLKGISHYSKVPLLIMHHITAS